MNRRSFFKVVTGFVAGIFAGSAKSEPQSLYKCDPNSANIDPNSEWAKQKPLTLDMLIKAKEELDQMERLRIEAVLKAAYPAYVYYPNGEIEMIHYKDFYKTKFS